MRMYSRGAQIFLVTSVVFMLLIGCTKKTETVSDDPVIEPAIVSSPRELIQRQGYDDLAFFFDASFEAMRCNPFTAVTHGKRFIYCNTTIIEISSQKIVGEFNIPISKQIPDLYFNVNEEILYIFIDDKLYAFDEKSGILSHKKSNVPAKEITIDGKESKVDNQHILYACKTYTISTLCSNGTAYLLKNQEGKHSIVDSSYNNLYYSLNKNVPIFGTLVSVNDSRRICQTRIVDLTRGKVEVSIKSGLVFCDTSMRYLFVLAATEGEDSDKKYYFTASLFTAGRKPLYTHKIAAFHENTVDYHYGDESIFKGYSVIDWAQCVKYARVFDNGDVICNIGDSITHISKNGSVTSVPFYTRCYDALSENTIVTHESCYISCVNIISLSDRYAKRKMDSELVVNNLKYVYRYRKENIQMASNPRSGDIYVFHDDVLYCYRYGETEPYTRIEMDVLVERMVFSWTKQALVLSAIDDGRDVIVYIDCNALSEKRIDRYSLYGDKSKYEYIRYEYDKNCNNSVLSEEIAWDYDGNYLPERCPSEMDGGKLLYCDDKVVVWMKKHNDYGILGVYDKHTEMIRDVNIGKVVFYVNKESIYAYDDDGIFIYDYHGKLLEKKNRPEAMVNAMKFDMTEKYIYMVKGDDAWCYESMYIYDRVRDRLNVVSIYDCLCINEDNRWVYKMYGLVAIARVFHGRPILISSAFNRYDDPVLKQKFRELSSLKW